MSQSWPISGGRGRTRRSCPSRGERVSGRKIGDVAKTLIREIKDNLKDLTFGVAFPSKVWKTIVATNEDKGEENSVNWCPFPDLSDELLLTIHQDPTLRGKNFSFFFVFFRSFLSFLFLFFFFSFLFSSSFLFFSFPFISSLFFSFCPSFFFSLNLF